MKRMIFGVVTLLFTANVFAQNENILAKPKVDKRVELLSIVFRLAEAQEYSMEHFKLYTDKINAHYAPYKNHELIQFVKEIRQERGIGYDAVMKMAVHLDENLNPITEFTDDIPESRWGKESANQFAKLLKDFYKQSNSEKFFKNNEALYEEASNRFLDIYNLLDVNWYKKFYGKNPEEDFIIINGLGNGGGNYGFSPHLPNQRKKVYAIMGAWSVDDNGMVVFPRKSNYLGTMIHEFCHSFVNYLLDQNPAPFQKNGAYMFDFVKDKMEKQAYGNWQTMLNEALVRASVVKYAIDHNIPKENVQGIIDHEKKLGFVWIEDLVTELEKYDKQRDIYPTLESYMPNLIKAYNTFAEKMPQYMDIDKKE